MPGQHGVDCKSCFEAKKRAHQRNEVLQTAAVRQKRRESRIVQEANPQNHAGLWIPRAHPDCCVDAKAAPGASDASVSEARALFGRKR